MYCSAAGDISKPWWQVSDEGAHEGRLFDKEVTTLGVTDKEKRGTGLKKKNNYLMIKKFQYLL